MKTDNKILSFIINEDNELLLLKGNSMDPQIKKSIWYVVTGSIENYDMTLEDAVAREIMEETNLKAIKVTNLNWIFKYNSLGTICTEYVFISTVKRDKIILNFENIDYEWLSIKDFIKKIYWFSDKETLINVLEAYIDGKIY